MSEQGRNHQRKGTLSTVSGYQDYHYANKSMSSSKKGGDDEFVGLEPQCIGVNESQSQINKSALSTSIPHMPSYQELQRQQFRMKVRATQSMFGYAGAQSKYRDRSQMLQVNREPLSDDF